MGRSCKAFIIFTAGLITPYVVGRYIRIPCNLFNDMVFVGWCGKGAPYAALESSTNHIICRHQDIHAGG